MTEVDRKLLDEEEVKIKLDCYRGGEMYYNLTLVRALNTIEARDKEIEALTSKVEVTLMQAVEFRNERDELKGQVAALKELIKHDSCEEAHEGWNDLLHCCKVKTALVNTQQTAQAFIAKERADEREKFKAFIDEMENSGYGGINGAYYRDLLTKEQA